jgi:ubiquinone biosynthesis protein
VTARRQAVPRGAGGRRRERGAAGLELRRAALLVWTLLRFGAGPAVRMVLRLPSRGLSYPVRVRMALEHLGLTYLKLGQYLAMRFDILPPEMCRELGKLFEDVSPMSFDAARMVVENDLCRPLGELFAVFEPQPIASASVAQVHGAWTWAGEHVAVKIQRPGIEEIFRIDIRILRRLTRVVDVFHGLGRLSATEMLDEFARWTLQETNFLREGHTAERVRRNAAPFEVIPAVHWDLSTQRVLTLQFIEGTSLAQLASIVETGGEELLSERCPDVDVQMVLHHMTFASLRQIFLHGLFHGDPHPGNILVVSENRVAFVDFGIFGELSRLDREILGGQIEQLSLANIDESLRFYLQQLTVTEDSDIQAFRVEARRVLRDWYELSLRPGSQVAERHVGKYIGEMIDISRRYHLLYDMSYLLYWRALNALHSTCLRLSPTFDLIGDLRRFFEETRPGAGERLAAVVQDSRTWAAAADLVAAAPEHLGSLMTTLIRQRVDTPFVRGEPTRERRSRDADVRAVVAPLAVITVLTATVHTSFHRQALVAAAAVAALWGMATLARALGS